VWDLRYLSQEAASRTDERLLSPRESPRFRIRTFHIRNAPKMALPKMATFLYNAFPAIMRELESPAARDAEHPAREASSAADRLARGSTRSLIAAAQPSCTLSGHMSLELFGHVCTSSRAPMLGRLVPVVGPAYRMRIIQCTRLLSCVFRSRGLYSSTVPLLNSPWSSLKKFRFRKFWRSYLDQNLLRITNPVSDLTGDQ
jgi:hypothetical protein